MLSEKFISSQLTVIVLQKLNDGLNFDQAGDGEQLPPDETDLWPVSGVQPLPHEADHRLAREVLRHQVRSFNKFEKLWQIKMDVLKLHDVLGNLTVSQKIENVLYL